MATRKDICLQIPLNTEGTPQAITFDSDNQHLMILVHKNHTPTEDKAGFPAEKCEYSTTPLQQQPQEIPRPSAPLPGPEAITQYSAGQIYPHLQPQVQLPAFPPRGYQPGFPFIEENRDRKRDKEIAAQFQHLPPPPWQKKKIERKEKRVKKLKKKEDIQAEKRKQRSTEVKEKTGRREKSQEEKEERKRKLENRIDQLTQKVQRNSEEDGESAEHQQRPNDVQPQQYK